MANILIIDDDIMLCEMLIYKVNDLGHAALACHSLLDGVKRVAETEFDLVFLDVRLPDGSGLTAIPELKAASSSPEVIIITGEGDPDGAEIAIKTGAWDYIEKPLSTREIILQLKRAMQYRQEKASEKSATLLRRDNIIGGDQGLLACLDLTAQAANTSAGVLITGETGTGKELFARAIHENSLRSKENFVVVDCAALPETLVESVLFGHIKGAFTGADAVKTGLIQEANKGTLFLDEVGELPLSIQKTFLRVLQEKVYRPVGSNAEARSDFRLIAATNRSLAEMSEKKQFRQDLLYRLRSVVIDLPPLRSRSQDIESLLQHYVSKVCKRYNMGPKTYSPEFLGAVESYHWPGNVREFVNAIDSAVVQAQNRSVLYPLHLPTHIRVELAHISIEPKTGNDIVLEPHKALEDRPHPTLKEIMDETEKSYLQDIFDSTNGNVQKACKISGLSKTRFYNRMKKYSISRPS